MFHQRPSVREALFLARERYEEAARAGRVGVWDWDLTSSTILVDPWLRDLLGVKEDDLPISTGAWLARVYDDDRPLVERELDAVVRGDRNVYDVEHRVRHADGCVRWLLARGVASIDTRGVPTRIVGTSTCITDRKAAESALASALVALEQVVDARTTELEAVGRRYRDLFDSAPAMYVLTRAKAGTATITDCNARFLERLGYTRAEVVGQPLARFYPPADRPAPETVDGGAAEDAVERQLMTRTGDVIDTWLHVAPETDTSGVTVGHRAMFVDITERKLAEARHRETESKYRLLVEQSLVGFYIIQDGQVVYINPKMGEIAGYPVDAVHRSVLDLVVEEDRTLVADNLRRRLAGDAVETAYTVRIRRRDGQVVPMEVHGVPIEYRGRPAVAGVALDVSERRRLEAQLVEAQKLESVGTLAAGIAHAFNNALTAICGRCELLLGEISKADPRRADVDAILAVAEESAALTRQLLAFGRRSLLEPREFDLNVAVGNTLDVAAPLIGEQIAIVPRLEPRLGLVRADPSQLEQALVNLLLNGRDAMPEGGTLTVTTGNVDLDDAFHRRHPGVPPGPYVRLTVSDTGAGMSAETLGHIFDPFFTTKEFGRGSGLGLATVHGIIKQTGGHIVVDSALHRGTTFWVYLPRLSEGPSETGDPCPARQTLETILLVEDEPHVRRTIRDMLTQVGYRVLATSGGADAMAVATRHRGRIDLLLTDVVMQGINGWELAAELSGRRRDLKVLYMTGYTHPHLPGDVDDEATLLRKPFAPRVLRRAVRQLLDQTRT